MRCAAVILAGGRGSRLGGVRKAELRVDGEALLAAVLGSAEACVERIVVGFPDLEVPAGVRLVQEDPPGSGPAAAVAAGVAALGPLAEWVLVLACDQPGAREVVPALLAGAAAAPPDVDSVFARTPAAALPERDGRGRRAQGTQDPRGAQGGPEDKTEWLTGIHRAGPLRRAIEARGDGVINGSVRRLFAPLRHRTVSPPPGSTRDIDTWADHDYWLERAAEGRM